MDGKPTEREEKVEEREEGLVPLLWYYSKKLKSFNYQISQSGIIR